MIKRILTDYLDNAYLENWRKFVRRLHSSDPFYRLWKNCCMEIYGKKVKLHLDTPTRWSSSVSMINKASNLSEAVEKMYSMTSLSKYREHHEFVPNWDAPDSEIWTFIKKVAKLFEPTIKAIQYLEGENYVTQSFILTYLIALEQGINKIKSNEDCPAMIVIINDLTESLNQIWDNLPIDTVIAVFLDPRLSHILPNIPKEERDEAISHVEKEYIAIVEKLKKEDKKIGVLKPKEMNSQDDDFFDLLAGDFPKKKCQEISPKSKFRIELTSFQNEVRHKGDPLEWWKFNQTKYPVLSILAKNYLAIPASQASCERLFSIAKHDMTPQRTHMKPDLMEALVITGKCKTLFNDV